MSAPDPAAVGRAIAERRSRVAELAVIREAAEELGIRVWLFGGTAAGFAHYVRWDLAREAGDVRYRESFFDYDFSNIYRSTQDADLVVDATEEQAERLEDRIKQKLAFLQGSKDHWEVRLLRSPRTVGNQVKLPLLANPDFLEQNTDSNSTGMIELTDPPPGESVVRDLRGWESPAPFFLQDVAAGRLHYYRSPGHQRTSRYLSGDNPPLFSVIRYLVKAFQYHLAIDGDDLREVRAIIDAFDPERDYPALSTWAKGWLERYGPNLIRHSVDIEYAWETLEGLGLRQKLIGLSEPSVEGTLGWWLSKEPLRSRPVGQGEGRSAAELGIGVVAHETRDFLAYESITRDTTLRPNVLVSRPNHSGEMAALGEGFYTRMGRSGARGTGLTIRFRVDPQAREGSDFTLSDDVVVFTNRAALQVIPESLDLSVSAYFRMLRDDTFDPADRGAWMKLRRRLLLRPLAREEETEIAALVSQELDSEVGTPWSNEARTALVVREWFALPASSHHPELVEKLSGVVSRLIDRQVITPLLQDWFALPPSAAYPELLERAIEQWASHSYLTISGRTTQGDHMLERIGSFPHWSGNPELVRILLRRGGLRRALHLLRSESFRARPELVLEAFDELPEGPPFHDPILRLLDAPHWREHPELVRRLIERGCYDLVARVLSGDGWRDHPELTRALTHAQETEQVARRLSEGLTALAEEAGGAERCASP